MITSVRQQNIDRFYNLMDELVKKFPRQTLDRLRTLRIPIQGVYFFFEPNELRQDGKSDRVVRIGTHAAVARSNSTLYDLLCNHKGANDLSGNHRGSVFRCLVGLSAIQKNQLLYPYWGGRLKKGDNEVKMSEKPLERLVSTYLHRLPFTVLEVPGPPSKTNDRAMIEENSIALLSNYARLTIDKSSEDWLGLYSGDDKVINSGLWNSKGVDRLDIDYHYFETFEKYLAEMKYWK